jgi:hypothetical protein
MTYPEPAPRTRGNRPAARSAAGILLIAALLAACGDVGARPVDGTAAAVRDSILPMETMIARYQADLPPVSMLGEDAPSSMDELIARFVAAVEDSSRAGLRALTLDAAEFAYLYFPTSIYARPPYAQPPAVNWLLLEQNSLKGEARLLRSFGGRPLDMAGFSCAGEPVVEGANRLHDRCTLRIRTVQGTADIRLFGSIIERDGRFRIMSLANRL